MSTRKNHSGRSPHKTQSTRKKSSSIRLMRTPEQLLEQGKLPEAIHLFQAELRRVPSNDPYRRLLGHCLFDTGQYAEAAQTWLELGEADHDDVLNVGIAYLNAREWDQAIVHLERARAQQENAQIYYLLALAYVRDKSWWGLDEETEQRLAGLLQRARSLPDCPPEVYLRLDDLLRLLARHKESTAQEEEEAWNSAREQGFQILEEAFSHYPDHTEVRLEFARILVYWRKQYETGLLVLAPLLQRKDLKEYVFEDAVGLSVEASLQAGWYEKTLQYLEMVPVGPPVAESDRPGLTKLQGDLFLQTGRVCCCPCKV